MTSFNKLKQILDERANKSLSDDSFIHFGG